MHSNVETLMSSYSFSVVEDSSDELSVLDVHVLEPIVLFFLD